MSAATIYDVARKARVSAMTVSRVINGGVNVDEQTRERVSAAIASLQYQVNQAARSARKGTMRVGMLCGSPGMAYLSDFLLGAMDQCSLQGAQLVPEKCGDLASQRTAAARLIENGAACILVPPPLCDQEASLRQLDDLGVPIVAVASARPAAHVHAVRIDDYQAAKTMMHHLFAAGHSDIAFILDDPGNARAQLRLQAYLDAMSVAGMSTRAGRLAEGGGSYRSGLAAARELLGHPDRPSAIFACNDDMAAAVVSVAQGMGLRVPQDLAVCGFDDMPIAASVWPGLTTIRQPVDEMARAAVQLALEAIKDAGRPRHCVLPYTLVQRESTTARATH